MRQFQCDKATKNTTVLEEENAFSVHRFVKVFCKANLINGQTIERRLQMLKLQEVCITTVGQKCSQTIHWPTK